MRKYYHSLSKNATLLATFCRAAERCFNFAPTGCPMSEAHMYTERHKNAMINWLLYRSTCAKYARQRAEHAAFLIYKFYGTVFTTYDAMAALQCSRQLAQRYIKLLLSTNIIKQTEGHKGRGCVCKYIFNTNNATQKNNKQASNKLEEYRKPSNTKNKKRKNVFELIKTNCYVYLYKRLIHNSGYWRDIVVYFRKHLEKLLPKNLLLYTLKLSLHNLKKVTSTINDAITYIITIIKSIRTCNHVSQKRINWLIINAAAHIYPSAFKIKNRNLPKYVYKKINSYYVCITK
ncbi:MAG: hypothetical protein KatS3mg083_087 [Candidatus Dojkabacteria bacterium]|nr:MAG: hypothetical protein KatS3mg083_087 [Candidatus Dojkabacteria bacterium]